MNQPNPLDTPGELLFAELAFPNPRASKTKDGPQYRVSFLVDQATWQLFQDAPSNIRLYAKMAVVGDMEQGATALEAFADAASQASTAISAQAQATQDTQKRTTAQSGANGGHPTKKPKQDERTPEQQVNGHFWQQAMQRNLLGHPDLQEWLLQNRSEGDVTPEQSLYRVFNVSSRVDISAACLLSRLEQDLPKAAMVGLRITINRLVGNEPR